MDQALFNTLSELEMQWEKEQMRGVSDGLDILDPEAAKLVAILAISNKARTIVEVGSGAGYATLWLAYAAGKGGGKVITCEIEPDKAEQTRATLQKAGLAERVEILVGDAREELRHREEAIDFVLIDADFGQYETYFDVVYKSMGIGGTLAAYRVVESENELADYTTYVQNHPSLESVTVPLAEGLEITTKTAD